MPVQSYTMGPGTLKLGTGGTQDASAQVVRFEVTPSESVDSGDTIDLLDGGQLKDADKVTLEWTASGEVVQDIAALGLVDYTWTNASEEVDFEFVPNTAADRGVTGVVRLVPLKVGGEAKTKPRSEFEWAIVGTPVLGDPTP